jgi:hypothetical protein
LKHLEEMTAHLRAAYVQFGQVVQDEIDRRRADGDDNVVGWRWVQQKTGLSKGTSDQVAQLVRKFGAAPVGTEARKIKEDLFLDAPSDSEDRYSKTFNAATRQYFIRAPGHAKTIVVAESVLKQMKRDYSTLGGAATLNQIAMHYNYSRAEVRAIKTACGWTHDSDPFLDEEIDAAIETPGGMEALEGEARNMHRRKLMLKIDRQRWEIIQRDAAKWWRFEEYVVEALRGACELLSDDYVPPPSLHLPQAIGEYAVAIMPTDLHYGKYGWHLFGPKSAAYSREEAATRLRESMSGLVELLPGKPKIVYAPVGSDFVHIDNMQGRTSSLKNQMDMDGVPEQILVEAIELAIEFFRHCLSLLPKDGKLIIPFMGGNHDWMFSIAIMMAVREHFRSDSRVFVEKTPEPYIFHKYGKNLIGFHHGHGLSKGVDLARMMATCAPEEWGQTHFRYWLTGNLHRFSQEEAGGVTTIVASSLSGADRWHVTNGYVGSQPVLQAFGFRPEAGLTWTFNQTYVP